MREDSDNQALHPTAAGPVTGRRYRYVVIYLLFAAWLCMKMVGCVGMFTGPWGPQIGGELPNGHTVWYRSRPVGRETEDQLVWINSHGIRREFWIQQFHAGPGYVIIRYCDGGDKVWVSADGLTQASIELVRGDFCDHARQHEWALPEAGTVLDEGQTFSLVWLIGPW